MPENVDDIEYTTPYSENSDDDEEQVFQPVWKQPG